MALRVGLALDDRAEQFGDRGADRVGVFGVPDAAVARHFDALQDVVVEQQFGFDQLGNMRAVDGGEPLSIEILAAGAD